MGSASPPNPLSFAAWAPLCAAALLCAPSSVSAQASGEALRLDLKLGVEADSNATREDGLDVISDTLTRYFLKLDAGSALSQGQSLGLKLRSGGKLFREQRDEDAFLNQVDARYVLYPTATVQDSPWFFTYASASLKDRTERGHQRDYTRGSGTAGLGLKLGPVALTGGGGYSFFAFKPSPDQSSQGPLVTAGLNVDIQDTWLFGLGYVGNSRDFDALLNEEGDARQDTSSILSASLGYQGSFVAGISLIYLDYQTLQRYTLSANLTTPLFWELLISGRALIQLSSYPENLEIDEDEDSGTPALAVDEDNRNAYTVALERPLYDNLRVELRYSLFTQNLGQENANYSRQLVFLGLGADY